MKHARIAIAAAAAGILTACASPPTMTRDQYLAATTRIYPGKSKEQVIDAAERVLRLADGDDFKIAHQPNGFQATRQWLIYLVIGATVGHDYWSLSVEDAAGGVKASVNVSTSEQSVAPVATSQPNTWSAGTTPLGSRPIDGTALYDVFWARMDYMLHRTDAWMTCDASNARVKAGTVYGANDALCNSFNMTDNEPGKAKARAAAGQHASQNFGRAAPLQETGPVALDRPPK